MAPKRRSLRIAKAKPKTATMAGPSQEPEDGEFEVEKILEKRTINGKVNLHFDIR